MRKPKYASRIWLIVLVSLFAGCGPEVTAPETAERIIVSNDLETLNQRVTYIPGQPETQKKSPAIAKFKYQQLATSTKIKLKLRAEIEAPVVDGQVLRANHLTFDQRRVYVAFSTVNSAYRGAIEIYDVQNIQRPRILSQALFKDTDITIAAKQDGKLFIGEATDSQHSSQFSSPACLEIIELKNGALTNKSQRFDLPSFNANDIACFDSTIFITTGTTNGSLSFFSNHSLDFVHQIKMERAKAVDKSDDFIVLIFSFFSL